MPTLLESQILDDFQARLAASTAIPDELVQKLMVLMHGTRTPAEGTILEAIKTTMGDQFE